MEAGILTNQVSRIRLRTNTRTNMQNIYPDQFTSTTLELNLPKPDWAATISKAPITPSVWFAQKFPDQAYQYGCPILELRQTSCDGFTRITPISINQDFFAAMLGGDVRL